MTTRTWWIGITILALALLAHAALPRYEWRSLPERPSMMIRVDRWTGVATYGQLDKTTGRWAPLR